MRGGSGRSTDCEEPKSSYVEVTDLGDDDFGALDVTPDRGPEERSAALSLRGYESHRSDLDLPNADVPAASCMS